MSGESPDKPIPPGMWEAWRQAERDRDDATVAEIEHWLDRELGDPPRPRVISVAVLPIPGRLCGPPGYPSWSAWWKEQAGGSSPGPRPSEWERSRERDRVAGLAAAERLRFLRGPHFRVAEESVGVAITEGSHEQASSFDRPE